jgi:hypothetical protein
LIHDCLLPKVVEGTEVPQKGLPSPSSNFDFIGYVSTNRIHTYKFERVSAVYCLGNQPSSGVLSAPPAEISKNTCTATRHHLTPNVGEQTAGSVLCFYVRVCNLPSFSFSVSFPFLYSNFSVDIELLIIRVNTPK